MRQVEDGGKPGEFLRRKQAIRSLRIPGGGPSERAVLSALIDRLPRIFASEEVLAEEAWCSVSTFKRACRTLVAAGVLEVQTRAHVGTFGATNVYLLKWDRIHELSRETNGCRSVDPSPLPGR